jgi:phage terminase small subunit
MDDPDDLTDKQRAYAQHVASGMESRAAAKAAGYSESFSRVAAHRLGKIQAVVRAKASIQAEGRKLAVYDLAKAMQEAADVIEFAKQHKHPTAYFFAVRHRAHLSGLLIDKVEIQTSVELKSALLEARGRVFTGYCPHCPHCRDSAMQALTDARPTGADTDSDGPDQKGNTFGD